MIFSSAGNRKRNGDSPVIPASAVNDNFCDCLNGIDEPKTSACAGVSAGFGGSFEEAVKSYHAELEKSEHHEVSEFHAYPNLFFCKNELSKSKFIYSSHVQDGFCDCCDGSDERPGALFDASP